LISSVKFQYVLAVLAVSLGRSRDQRFTFIEGFVFRISRSANSNSEGLIKENPIDPPYFTARHLRRPYSG